MIRWIVVLVFIVCVGPMHGQTLRVVEKDTGIPLEWVTVQTILGDWNDITNSQGEVTLPALH